MLYLHHKGIMHLAVPTWQHGISSVCIQLAAVAPLWHAFANERCFWCRAPTTQPCMTPTCIIVRSPLTVLSCVLLMFVSIVCSHGGGQWHSGAGHPAPLSTRNLPADPHGEQQQQQQPGSPHVSNTCGCVVSWMAACVVVTAGAFLCELQQQQHLSRAVHICPRRPCPCHIFSCSSSTQSSCILMPYVRPLIIQKHVPAGNCCFLLPSNPT